MAQAQKEFSVVGKRVPRIDAYERVTGQAQYTGDIQLPGMLYARVLRLRALRPPAHRVIQVRQVQEPLIIGSCKPFGRYAANPLSTRNIYPETAGSRLLVRRRGHHVHDLSPYTKEIVKWAPVNHPFLARRSNPLFDSGKRAFEGGTQAAVLRSLARRTAQQLQDGLPEGWKVERAERVYRRRLPVRNAESASR